VIQTNLSGIEQSGRSSGAQIIDDGHRPSNGPGPNVMDAATLAGDSVVNAAGEDLGKIEAIMLDVTSGRIAYAVLSFGGFLGMGKKLFALPWGALTLDAVEKRFILDASKERLENAEGFDKDHWPSMAEPGWATRLHSYYNVTPYWHPENALGDIRRPADSIYATDRAGRPVAYREKYQRDYGPDLDEPSDGTESAHEF
jgi:sporulation protein YlmC with PRC-barrel domain